MEKRTSIKEKNYEYKKKLCDLEIKKAEVKLETALIEKEVAENNRKSSISELKQNEFKEEMLKLELQEKLLKK